VSQIPTDFMNNANAEAALQDLIAKLEESVDNQQAVDGVYEDFCDVMQREMEDKLPQRKVTYRDGPGSNKKRRTGKPWWTDALTLKWNARCEAEDRWRHATGAQRARTRATFTEARKDFDRHVQRAKRDHWRQQQDHLMEMSHGDPKRFWQYIGQLGVAKEKRKQIPMEIVDDDEKLVQS
jgi:hypothetical protein